MKFSFLSKSAETSCEIPEIFPLTLECGNFVNADVEATYARILTDTLERTAGISDAQQILLWDNCVQSENSKGLVSLLTKAMVNKADLFLVYKPSLNILRVADATEKQLIEKDYKEKNKSDIGVFVSFRNYGRTDMLKVFSSLEYCVLTSLHKTMNISKAVQLKMSGLRSGVSLNDSATAIAQAQAIADALRKGQDVLLDKEDDVTNATPDIGPTEKAIQFLDAKRAYYLNLPLAYVTGLQTGGIGSTGEADMRAVERGLKQFYFSIIKPVVENVFSTKTEFKSQDFRQVTSALEALKTFELVSDDDLLPRATMRDILARLFDVDPKELEKALRLEREERGPNDSNFQRRFDRFEVENV